MSEKKVVHQTEYFEDDKLIALSTQPFSKKLHKRNGLLKSDLDYTDLWIQTGANLDVTADKYGDTFLHNAVRDKKLEKLFHVPHLKKQIQYCINLKNNNGQTPLDIALHNFLNKKRYLVISIESEKDTFLKYIEWLIVHGAKLDKDNLLEISSRCQTSTDLEILDNIMNHLKEDYEGKKSYICVALNKLVTAHNKSGLIKLVEWLIECGAKLDKTTSDASTHKKDIQKLFNTIKKLNVSYKIENFLWNYLRYLNVNQENTPIYSLEDLDISDDDFFTESCDIAVFNSDESFSKEGTTADNNQDTKKKPSTKVNSLDILPEDTLNEIQSKINIHFTNCR